MNLYFVSLLQPEKKRTKVVVDKCMFYHYRYISKRRIEYKLPNQNIFLWSKTSSFSIGISIKNPGSGYSLRENKSKRRWLGYKIDNGILLDKQFRRKNLMLKFHPNVVGNVMDLIKNQS
jgi:hypothetical protein